MTRRLLLLALATSSCGFETHPFARPCGDDDPCPSGYACDAVEGVWLPDDGDEETDAGVVDGG